MNKLNTDDNSFNYYFQKILSTITPFLARQRENLHNEKEKHDD